MRLVLLVSLPAVAIVAASATAEAAAPVPSPAVVAPLSLAEALSRARAHSARLAQLSSLEAAAAAALRGARAARTPLLDLSASYGRSSNVPELTLAIPGAPPRTVFPNIPDNYRARAGVVLPLYTGGRIERGITVADQQRAAAAKDVESGAADLTLEATGAYWTLVSSRENARVLAEAVASFEAHLGDAAHRRDAGMAARNEVLAVQVERDRAELSRLAAGNAAEVAHANLLRLIGLPLATRLEPTEPLAAAAPPREDAETLLANAVEARAEIAALRARAAALEASARAARGATLPQASLSAAYEYANPNTRILPLASEWKGTWNVAASVSITAFDGGRAAAAVAQAQSQADAARYQMEDLSRRIRLEVTSRLLDLDMSWAAIEVAERSLEAARENVRVSRDRFGEGLIPSSELLDAETALLRAGLDRTAAFAGLHLAVADLDRAVGR